MPLSRRQFILASGLTLGAVSSLTAQASDTQQPVLFIPPLLESRHGQPLFLTLQQAQWAFWQKQKTPVWGINGQYLGPTIRIYDGDDVKVIYSNRLAEPISMTISGLQLPGTLMGGAARMISPGVDWSPVLPIRQAAATCWYHANTPNRMAPHVYNGLAGICLVEDKISKAMLLPNHYGVDDFPIIIQDKRLNNFGVPEYNPPVQGGFMGNTLLVNGVQSPFVEVSRGWVRLRLLNASNARRYLLQRDDGLPMHVVASDQGFLPAPVAVQQLSIVPGERREVIIDMAKGSEVSITAGEPASVMERLRDLFDPSNILISTLLLTLKPTGLLPLVTDNLPARLPTNQILDGNATRSREFHLGGDLAGINGVIWGMNRIDIQAKQGTWERWTLHAEMPQAFHVQGVSFLVKTVNGAPAMGEDRGWKDTVWVDGSTELLVYFNQISSNHFPFVYYSQSLEMADRGSAGQLVTEATTI